MSGDIARWDAIPLSRPGHDIDSNIKQPKLDDHEDDDISLVSRTPSPSPTPNAMKLDVDNIHQYDEHVGGFAREVVTVDTKIKRSNKGFALLAKLGWVEGQPLGLAEDGRVDPIPFQIKRDTTGLGKTSQDVRMIETTVSQRRGLDSERQTKETEDQRKAREDIVARKTALESEMSTILKSFYCELCDKQFKNVAQYDEHTNSYAHHHKARFRDMQANIRLKPKDEVSKLKEKERKREEKELRKIAAANGIKMLKQVSIAAPNVEPPDITGSSSYTDAQGSMTASKRGGLGFSTTPTSSRSNWAPIAQPTAPPAPPPMPTPSLTTPSFRNAGWISLDTGISSASNHPPTLQLQTPPPPPPTDDAPPTPPSSGVEGWSYGYSVDMPSGNVSYLHG